MDNWTKVLESVSLLAKIIFGLVGWWYKWKKRSDRQVRICYLYQFIAAMLTTITVQLCISVTTLAENKAGA